MRQDEQDNAKFEIRNPKQIRMTKHSKFETMRYRTLVVTKEFGTLKF